MLLRSQRGRRCVFFILQDAGAVGGGAASRRDVIPPPRSWTQLHTDGLIVAPAVPSQPPRGSWKSAVCQTRRIGLSCSLHSRCRGFNPGPPCLGGERPRAAGVCVYMW